MPPRSAVSLVERVTRRCGVGRLSPRASRGSGPGWSQKQRLDEIARSERIQRARRDLADLGRRLAGPRARIGSLVAAEEAAAALLSATGAQRWVSVTVTEATTETLRQEKRGRPGKDTRYRKTPRPTTP